jgi:hypothetical protein
MQLLRDPAWEVRFAVERVLAGLWPLAATPEVLAALMQLFLDPNAVSY